MPLVYVVRAAPTQWDHWGDYAAILVHGMTGHLGRKDGLLQLERTGPFVPSITFPGISDIVLGEAVKRRLEVELPSLSFRPVLSTRIVLLDWPNWNAILDEPPFLPETGEPEDYVLAQPHDPQLAEQMGRFWELVPVVAPEIQGRNGALRAAAYRGQHLVRAHESGGYNFVSGELCSALTSVAAQCVTFQEAVIEHGA
jgi:hypothetical protein